MPIWIITLFMVAFFLVGALLGWGIRGILEYRRHQELIREIRKLENEMDDRRGFWLH